VIVVGGCFHFPLEEWTGGSGSGMEVGGKARDATKDAGELKNKKTASHRKKKTAKTREGGVVKE